MLGLKGLYHDTWQFLPGITWLQLLARVSMPDFNLKKKEKARKVSLASVGAHLLCQRQKASQNETSSDDPEPDLNCTSPKRSLPAGSSFGDANDCHPYRYV